MLNTSLIFLYNWCMKNLKINFDCLDGYYNLNVFDDHTYSIETNIEYLETKSGIIDNFSEFENKLNEANILSWDSDYDSNIENPVRWNVTLDNHTSSGLEGNWPYTYDKLIEAIMIIDSKIDCFKANVL